MRTTLFEVSWEVCNKVGGIHTVVSTKARTLVERLGDEYIAIGPWLLSDPQQEAGFEEEQGFEVFAEGCRALGVPVKVGRWRIPGRPRTILVEFSALFPRKDAVLSELWEKYKVDSLTGGWDYVEPVLFGHAAGLVIERWWHSFLGSRGQAIAQFHEWMTGSGLLYLEDRLPQIGSVFTTHATMLGRALSATGRSPEDGLGGQSPEELAEALGVRSKHSLEGIAARVADVFTTVSEITAREAELLHGRKPEPLLPNGIDLAVIDELCGETTREEAERALRDLASRFCGESLDDAALLCLSGRYEFHNKGVDLLLESLALLNRQGGRRVALFLMVPAGHSGIASGVLERLRTPSGELEASRAGPLGISTHHLFDPQNDPVQQGCRRLGLDNALGSRVKVLQIPIYLHRGDGLLNMSYEACLRAMDLSCFPSFYEPWGYTPEESLAVGVPTVTSDHAGFGRWARAEGLGAQDGVFVLERVGVADGVAAESLAAYLSQFFARPMDEASKAKLARICRRTAQRTAWSDLIRHYDEAFRRALATTTERVKTLPTPPVRPKLPVPVAAPREANRPHLAFFEVSATLPPELAGLERLSRNFWWSWDPEGQGLFRELSPLTWEASGHNPVLCLQLVYPEDLAARAADAKYVRKLERVLARFDAYLRGAATSVPLGERDFALSPERPVAYFCAEFGLQESLRIYSGGLGILAGDHLKSASDLNLPLVGVGLFYRLGYLRQRVTAGGEQIALDADNDPRRLPLALARDQRGEPIEITLQLPSSVLTLRAWIASVGRVQLYLLDSNVESNRPEDREITARLYGGDQEARLRQEIALGRGGVRLLQRLGLEPSVWHINEGHAAFLALERVARLIREDGLTLDEARECVCSSTVFTTHTPVPAGHDRFSEDLMRRYFSDAASAFGAPWERFMAWGQSEGDASSFNMTYLALSFSDFPNAVSKLHAEVTKDLLHPYWPKLLKNELPVESITNGVHLPSWTDPEIARLFAAPSAAGDERAVTGEDFALGAAQLDAQRFWSAKRAAKRRLLDQVRLNLERGFLERHDRPGLLSRLLPSLDERALVLGFARRFAPYKRALLLFRDRARLQALLANKDRPVLVLLAGKAHPNDQFGKDLLKHIVEVTREDSSLGRVLFLDDYDIDLARSLVQGVDLWLNNPVRRLEASGTSGMKVAANGGLNLSVPDGWWPEAYDQSNGWSLGAGKPFADAELQDELDSAMLYRLLEEEILPLYFRRDERGIPSEWLERVRRNFATIPPQFDTGRMVREYRDRAYFPLARQQFALRADGYAQAKERARAVQHLRREFGAIRIVGAKMADLKDLRVGDSIGARVEVDLGTLSPQDVLVELVLGHTKNGTNSDLHNLAVVPLLPVEGGKGAPWGFEGAYVVQRSGSFAYGIRVRAREVGSGCRMGDLVLWA
jgi:glycogen phosphorylase/synthase